MLFKKRGIILIIPPLLQGHKIIKQYIVFLFYYYMSFETFVAVAVVIAFFICWAPFHVQRLIAIYGTNKEDHITSNGPWMVFLYLLMTYVSGVLYYVSTTINPILYNIMSNKFRMAFMVSKTET